MKPPSLRSIPLEPMESCIGFEPNGPLMVFGVVCAKTKVGTQSSKEAIAKKKNFDDIFPPSVNFDTNHYSRTRFNSQVLI